MNEPDHIRILLADPDDEIIIPIVRVPWPDDDIAAEIDRAIGPLPDEAAIYTFGGEDVLF